MIDISSEEIPGTEPFIIQDRPADKLRMPEKRCSPVSCVLHPGYIKYRESRALLIANSRSEDGNEGNYKKSDGTK